MDMSKYKGMFISETKEHLRTMNHLIISLEKDPKNRDDIDALFREAHSIKGMAASMGYHGIADLSHKMEDMMDLFRKGEAALNPDAVDLLFEALDALEAMVGAVEEERSVEEDYSSIISRLVSVKEAGASQPEPQEPVPAGTTEEIADERIEEVGEEELEPVETPAEEGILDVRVKVARSAQIPGMRGFLAYKKLEEFGRVLSVDPDIESVKKGDFDNEITVRISTDLEPGEIEKALGVMVDLAGFKVERAPVGAKPPEKAEGPSLAVEEGKPGPPARKARQIRTVRVATDLLDNLINIVGEMIIARSRLLDASKKIASAPLKEAEVLMSNLIRDLHDRVMTVRMTPIENLMERLPRVVRDIARKSGKKVELSIAGRDIELDRAIVDEMGDPLVHILRNCVDHGIELPDEREKEKKNPTGRILIRAMRERDQVIINVEDDGRGMDAGKIKRKAVERGLIKEDQARMMSDKDAFMLVCHSGLSTAEKVTDVSGRGVGMDAVKNVVDSIGGSVDIDSVLGRGTSITIKLPLTVAIVQVLLVRLGGETFAIPINKIIRTLEVSKGELKRSQKQLAVLADGELIPLLSLRKILRIESVESPAPLISIVVVEIRNKKVGLVVDTLVGQQEAFIKPLERPLEWIRGFSGATILGDGSVVFVLDTSNLL